MGTFGIITILQNVCYNFLSILSNLFPRAVLNFKGKGGSLDIWDLLSLNRIGQGVYSKKKEGSKVELKLKLRKNCIETILKILI